MSVSELGLVVASAGAAAALILPVEFGILVILLVLQAPWAADLVGQSGSALRPVDVVMAVWCLRLFVLTRRGVFPLEVLRTAPVRFWGAWIVWVVVATTGAQVFENDLHGGAQLVSTGRLAAMALLMPITVVLLSNASGARTRTLLTAIAGLATLQAAASFGRWAPAVFLDLDWVARLGQSVDQNWISGRDPILAYPLERRPRWTGSFGDPATFGYFMLVGLAALWARQRWAGQTRRFLLPAALVVAALYSLTRTVWIGLFVTALAGWAIASVGPNRKLERRHWVRVGMVGTLTWLAFLGAQSVVSRIPPPAITTVELPATAPESPGMTPSPWPLSPADVVSAATTPPPAPPPGLRSLLRMEFDASASGRLQMIQLSLYQFSEHPLLGVGWSGRRFHGDVAPWGEPLYTRLLAETGLIGLVLFLAFVVACLRSAWVQLRASGGEALPVVAFGAIGLSAFLGVLTADLLIVGPSVTNAALFLLAGAAAARPEREPYPEISS